MSDVNEDCFNAMAVNATAADKQLSYIAVIEITARGNSTEGLLQRNTVSATLLLIEFPQVSLLLIGRGRRGKSGYGQP